MSKPSLTALPLQKNIYIFYYSFSLQLSGPPKIISQRLLLAKMMLDGRQDDMIFDDATKQQTCITLCITLYELKMLFSAISFQNVLKLI